MEMRQVYEFMDSQYESMVHLWKEIVLIESDSNNIEGVNMLASHMDTYLVAMGLVTKKYTFPNAGASVAAWTPKTELAPIVLMAHMDTVYPKGSFGEKLWNQQLGVVYGGGVYDCKGGVAIALLVAKALQYAGYKKRQIKVLLTGDEEMAHELSGGKSLAVFKDNVPGAAVAFSCEAAPANGDVVLQRKGANIITIKVKGITAHTGKDPMKGASAIREAARVVESLEALNDYPDGVICNVGRINGGSAVNTVPDYCEITASLRYSSMTMYNEAMQKIREICNHPRDARISLTLEEGAKVPAMEKVAKTEALFELYQDACHKLGYKAPAGIYAGEASDAAYTTLEGIPTICGCGVRGGENHTLKEWAYEASVVENAKKIVATIMNLPAGIGLS